MKRTLVDTDVLSLFLRNNRTVYENFARHQSLHGTIYLSIITYYETTKGLRARDAQRRLPAFVGFAQQCDIINLSLESVDRTAKIYAELRRSGQSLADADLLIAGVALANDLRLATRNHKHFGRIDGLQLIDWSETIET